MNWSLVLMCLHEWKGYRRNKPLVKGPCTWWCTLTKRHRFSWLRLFSHSSACNKVVISVCVWVSVCVTNVGRERTTICVCVRKIRCKRKRAVRKERSSVCVCVWERERERERERDRERQRESCVWNVNAKKEWAENRMRVCLFFRSMSTETWPKTCG